MKNDENFSENRRIMQLFVATVKSHHQTIDAASEKKSGLHRSQHRILMYLSFCNSNPSQKEIAGHFDISPAAVAVSLNRLENDGYISRKKGKGTKDGRFNEICITEKGKTAALESKKIFDEIDNRAFSLFDDSEKKEFEKLLQKMQDGIKLGQAKEKN